MADIERKFELIGKGLIDCSEHCPATQKGEKKALYRWAIGLQDTIKTSPQSFYIPICNAPNMPVQEEKTQEGRNPNRVCIYWANQHKITVEEKKN